MRRFIGRGRRRAALAAAVVATVAMVPALPSLADPGSPSSPLAFQGFVHLKDLSCGPGCVPNNVRLVGADPALGRVVLFNRSHHTIMTIDSTKDAAGHTSYAQNGTYPLGAFPALTMALDLPSHTVMMGTGNPSAGACPVVHLPCAAGPTAVTPQMQLMHLPDGVAKTFTFPAASGGESVIAMTQMHPAAGAPIVLALLFKDQTPLANGVGKSLTLYALDPTKMDDSKPAAAASAVLWTQDIPMCATTPSWSVSVDGSQPEFLGTDPAGTFAYFACRGLSGPAASTIQPAGAVVVDFGGSAFPQSAPANGFATTFYPNGANTSLAISGGDAAAGLLYLASVGNPDKLYVFDAAHRAWTGSAPFPLTSGNANLYSVPSDPSNGRAYVLYANDFTFGLQTDQVPAPQGTKLSFGDFSPVGATGAVIDPTTHTLFIATTTQFTHSDQRVTYPGDDAVAVFTDTRPQPDPATPADPDALTHDTAVTADTPVSFGGFASAYGVKATAVGGVRSTPAGLLPGEGSPAGAVDFLCFAVHQASADVPCPSAPHTSDGTRTLTVAEVGRTEVSRSAAAADGSPIAVDSGTEADQSAVASYNAPNSLWEQLVGGSPPAGGPTAKDALDAVDATPVGDAIHQQQAPAGCADYGKGKLEPRTSGAVASCDYAGEQAGAAAVSPTSLQLPEIQVADAMAQTAVGRTPTNQVLTTATATARGITIAVPGGPTVSIGEVTATATSAAAGRAGTAKSDYQRQISDVTVTAPGQPPLTCGFDGSPCDLKALNDALAAQFDTPLQLEMPAPDSDPIVRHSPGGAQAEVIKSKYQFWNDFLTDGDSGVEVPALRVVFVGDQYQPSRLVVNLAAVHVESHDAIGLLPPPPPALPDPSLELKLVDDATPPAALSGATFTLQGPQGTAPVTCLTAADGIGTCKFAKLPVGSYTIVETTPPPGFAAAKEYKLNLEAGKVYKTSFVNLPAIGSVKVALRAPGDDAKPLAGGVFAMFKGDDVLATPVATCTTDADGGCGFDTVPLGTYTMTQVTAPDGYLVTDSVPFELAEPKQVVTVKFVDGIPGVAPVPPTVIPGKPAIPPKVIPGKPAIPPKVIPGKPAVPPRTMVLPAVGGSGAAGLDAVDPASYDASSVPPPVVSSQDAAAMAPLQLGGGLGAVPVRLARLVVHSPQQAVLLLFVWLILGTPVYLWVRRRQFILDTERL